MKKTHLPFTAVTGVLLLTLSLSPVTLCAQEETPAPRTTSVSIVGDQFFINGNVTYEGRTWNGMKVEGLLMNSRMVQGTFDDRNPETVQRWAYPDTGKWDAERNTREFLEAMPLWHQHGLMAFTLNLQGGNPERYAKDQPWHNSAFESDGSLRKDYLTRLESILDKADELGMVVILGYFYFGQDQRLADEPAVIRATDNITNWLLERGYRNVLVEVCNECNVRYDHAILQPQRVHELIMRVRETTRNFRRLYVGVSYGGGTIPSQNVARVSDFLLLHGNGVSDPARIAEMVRQTRAVSSFMNRPILFNEDDHFGFDKPTNNFTAALSEYASWGYFDPGTNNYLDGYQSPPVNWAITTDRKAAYFKLLGEITGTDSAVTKTLPRWAANAEISTSKVTVQKQSYHGWPEAYVMSNGKADVVIVPAIGRIMQFGFTGEEGVFWENRSLDGQPAEPNASEWINFGGDKTWPAPESEWSKYTGKVKWRPPLAFDGMPAKAEPQDNGDVLLTTEVDPSYGIRVQRRISLDPLLPLLTISTRYEKVSGRPVPASIWIITQLRHPTRVFAALPKNRKASYVQLIKQSPAEVTAEPGLLSLSRDLKTPHKIGCVAEELLWMNDQYALRMESVRVSGNYPDQNSSAEIYTSADPLPYIELEMLGPIQTLKPGQSLEKSTTYTLFRRTDQDAAAEARRLLAQ